MKSWFLRIGLAALLLACLCACGVKEEPAPPPQVLPLPEANVEPEPVFYDFFIGMGGSYTDESKFPRPEVLQTLRREWEETWLPDTKEGHELEYDFGQWAKENGLTCYMDWAYTEDFDGDGTEETVFSYGLAGGLLDTTGLYFLNADGALIELDKAPYFAGFALRYPHRTQLIYQTDHGTGLSLYSNVIGFQDGKAEVLLNTRTNGFYKEGCFLCTTPRVGSAMEIKVDCYYWDEPTRSYKVNPCVPLDLEELSYGVRQYAERDVTDGGYTLVRAATVADYYYYFEYEDSEGETYIQLSRRNNTRESPRGMDKISGFYRFELEYLLDDPGLRRIDYYPAMSHAVPVEPVPLISPEEEERAIEFLRSHVDLQKELGRDDYTVMVTRYDRRGWKDWYLLAVGAATEEKFVTAKYYLLKMDYSRIIETNTKGPDYEIWPQDHTPQGEI